MQPIEIPPTAGLPILFEDLFPSKLKLDDEIAELLGIPQPILCCSGTAALIIALKTLAENNPRNTVIIPAFSCPLVVMAIAYCGLKVKLCDTAHNSFDFNFEQLASIADKNTLVIISTHLGGKCADVVRAKQIADAVGCFVIEDAAQSLGATIEGKSVGLTSDIGFFSLAAGKGLTSYEGGVLYSKDANLHKKMAEMAKESQPFKPLWEIKRSIELLGYFLFYRPSLLRYVYGLPHRKAIKNNDWVTALGERFDTKVPMHTLGKWRQNIAANAASRLPDYFKKTAKQAVKRIKILEEIPNLIVIKDNYNSKGVYPFIMLLFPSQITRDTALENLTPLGLGASRLFAYPLNEYDYLKSCLSSADLEPNQFPVAKDFSKRLLTMSNSLWLEDAQFHRIIEVMKISCHCN